MRAKLDEIQILRGIAALAVVLIHTSATYLPLIKNSNALFLFFGAVNSLPKFAVQIFIFISGLVLFYGYKDREYNIWDFYLKRIKCVFVPYVFWTGAYLLTDSQFLHKPLIAQLESFFASLVTGQASYHTYFILLILQFYLLFPWLHKFIKRHGFHRMVLFWAAIGYLLLVCFDYYFVGLGKFTLPKSYLLIRSKLCIYWYFYFLLGAYVGLNFESWKIKADQYKKAGLVLMLLVLAVILTEFFIVVKQYKWDIGFAATPLKPSIFLYTLFSIIGLFGIAQRLSQSEGYLNRFLVISGKHSFGLYFAHPMLLRIFVTWHLTSWMVGNFVVSYFLTVITTLVLVNAFTKNKQAAVLTGAA